MERNKKKLKFQSFLLDYFTESNKKPQQLLDGADILI